MACRSDTTARVEAWSISRKYERRDANEKRLAAIFKASEDDRKKCFAGISEMWNLELLVTDGQYRGRGAATRPAKWGTAEADNEGVCCGVAASGMGARVYAACGFRKLTRGVVTWCRLKDSIRISFPPSLPINGPLLDTFCARKLLPFYHSWMTTQTKVVGNYI